MGAKLLLSLCAVLMLIMTATCRKRYHISLLKWIPLTICVGLMGYLGTYIMFYLENGTWYGQSFFGAVLFYPILLLPIAFVFTISLSDLLDYATPPGMAVLVLFKMNCYLGGCCGGRVLYFDENGIPVFFPSQIVELVCALILTIILVIFSYKKKFKGLIYPITLILYGGSRFILNFFRYEWSQREAMNFIMPMGNIWSLVAIMIGFVWLLKEKYWCIRNNEK